MTTGFQTSVDGSEAVGTSLRMLASELTAAGVPVLAIKGFALAHGGTVKDTADYQMGIRTRGGTHIDLHWELASPHRFETDIEGIIERARHRRLPGHALELRAGRGRVGRVGRAGP